MSADPRSAVTRTLDLHEILEDECAALFPGSGTTRPRLDDPDAYRFSAEQLKDITTLARMISESAVVVANPSAARVALAAIADGQAALLAEARAVSENQQWSLVPAASFAGLLVARL